MTLSEHLSDSIEKKENVNESLILGALVATACLSFVANGFFNSDFMKSVGGGLSVLLGGIGSLFGKKKDDSEKDKDNSKKDKDDTKNGESQKTTSTENDQDTLKKSCLGLMAIAEQANKNVKDETEKKKNESLLNLLAACSYDKDGNDIPMEERMNKMKEMVGEENWDAFKKDMEDTYNKHKDSKEFKDALENAKNNMKAEDAEAFVNSVKEKAKTTLQQVEKEKAEQAELDEEINKLKEKIANNMVTGDDEERLRGMLEKRKMLAEKSVVGTAVPATAQSMVTDPKQLIPPSKEEMDKAQKEEDDTKKAYDDAKKEVDDLTKSLEGKDKDSQEYKDIKAQIDEKSGALEDLKKKSDDAKKANDELKAKKATAENGGKTPTTEPQGDPKQQGDPEPKEKTVDDIEKEYKEQSKALEKEYQDKIDKETDPKKKEDLENEWMKKEAKLKADKHKAQDAIDDNDDHDTENDATKKGKYKVKEEEITDPETGEKKTVTTYTGPRGGKFYYPDGKPKTPENKVYVHESIKPYNFYTKLKNFLLENLIK